MKNKSGTGDAQKAPSQKHFGKPVVYRPPQKFLDVFWTLSEGNDEQRNKCASKLGNMIAALSTDEEKKHVLNYCKERLIRGLSSGRKFARVGFSVALTRLLRQFNDIDAADILATVQDKLKVVKHDKKTKSEVGGIYLGRAFAYSSLIQSGAVQKMTAETLVYILDDLTTIAEKKSYIKPVCSKTMEDLVKQVSVDTFGEHIWPKLRDTMKLGWEGCSLDRLFLLITCRDTFPDVVNKKFVKKHWGLPVLGEENDDKLIKLILDAQVQKKEVLLTKLLPRLTKERDIASIWAGLGGKLMKDLPEKKVEVMQQHHLLGVQLAGELAKLTESSEQLLNLVLSPTLAGQVFHNNFKKKDPLAAQGDLLFAQVQDKLKEDKVAIAEIVQKVWNLDAELSEDKDSRVDLIGSANFSALVTMLPQEEGREYVDTLMDMVKGKDKWCILSSKASKKSLQIEAALRHIHTITCAQNFTSPELQKAALTLFLRLAFFEVKKKTKGIAHCESCINFDEVSGAQKLCEAFFFKSLDQLSTMTTGYQSKSSHLESYIEVVYHAGQYFETLMKADNVKPIKKWQSDFGEEWNRLFTIVTKIKQKSKKSLEAKDSAFLLLFLFLGFHLLVDHKTATDLLQEVYVCYEKATPSGKPPKKKLKTSPESDGTSDEPDWIEVVMEVLLSVLSMQSHLGRVVTSMVFRCLGEHITPQAIRSVTEVLIPKAGNKDDILVEEQDEEEEDLNGENGKDEEDDDLEDEGILLDEDVPDEESDDDSDEDDDDDDDNEEEDMEEEIVEEGQIDDEFKKKVKEALGTAATKGDAGVNGGEDDADDEESLPDLSDSEMFKLDEMLAEVFRQKKKAGNGKKAREEKKREMANFRSRVLDLVEVMVKGERSGDFVLDLLKPLLLLILKGKQPELVLLGQRAEVLFHHIKSKVKSLKDNVHTVEEIVAFYQELIDLAHSVTEVEDVKEVALACHIVMALARSHSDDEAATKCLDVVKGALASVINKKHAKLGSSFFSLLVEMEPVWYLDLAATLSDFIQASDTKTHGKIISCSVLASLAKRTGNVKPEDVESMRRWIENVAAVVGQELRGVETNNIKFMVTKELLSLANALATRTDLTDKPLFDMTVKEHLQNIRPKLNTDLRKLANKLMAGIMKSLPQEGKKDEGQGKNKDKKKNKKRPENDLQGSERKEEEEEREEEEGEQEEEEEPTIPPPQKKRKKT